MPLHCVELLIARNQRCIFLDTGSSYSPFMGKRLQNLGVQYFNLSSDNLYDFFQSEESTLIISASNMLIFPKEWVVLPHITIFNYHNSLLPRHKGVNAEAWTIYEGDRTAGVTWHKVEKSIDSGRILAQKEFLLPHDITAGQLLKKQASEALTLLEKNVDSVVSGTYSLKEQMFSMESLHKKSERPNNGELSIDWDSDKIWRFLRAYDYGISRNLGTPAVRIGGKLYAWSKYKKACRQPGRQDFFPEAIQIKDIILQNLYPISD